MARLKIYEGLQDNKNVSQRARGRNTNNETPRLQRNRARSWCFTLNNHTVDDGCLMSQLFSDILKSKMYIFQEETGKNGTPHLQGCVRFNSQVSFSTLKREAPRCHWEICRNWAASKNYCQKEETRTGKLWIQNEEIKTDKREADEIALRKWIELNREPFIEAVMEKLTEYGWECPGL